MSYARALLSLVFILITPSAFALKQCPHGTGADTPMMLVCIVLGLISLIFLIYFSIQKYKKLSFRRHKIYLVLTSIVIGLIIFIVSFIGLISFALACT